MRLTRQRQIILKAVQENRVHPDADFIYHLLKPEYPELSLGTVYRNLNVLSEAGMITRITTPFNREHYDGETRPHYHLFCEECRTIVDLAAEYRHDLDAMVQENQNFRIKHHEIVFHGVCEACQHMQGQKHPM